MDAYLFFNKIYCLFSITGHFFIICIKFIYFIKENFKRKCLWLKY